MTAARSAAGPDLEPESAVIVARSRRGFRLPSNVVAAGITFVVLLSMYLATAAPDLTFWDASELTTAAHTLGIPHAPGTPLWMLLGRIASLLFSAAGPARAVTMLSVWCSAAVGAVGALMATRWIGARGAVASSVSAGAMMSVWANATETEVYAASLLLSVLMLALGERAGRRELSDVMRARWRGALVFAAALSVPLHLSTLVALPAAVALAWHGARPHWRECLSYVALAALALSALAILPLRARHSPLLDSGHAVSMQALWQMITRQQFDVPRLWPRRAPLWLQLGNVFQWADWQVAFGVHPLPTPSWPRTALTVLWAWLAILGVRTLCRHDVRVGRAMALLLVSGTIGVALWLNLRVGPSFGDGVLSTVLLHEARERDYFFVLGFWSWGLLAGAGIAGIASKLAARLPRALAPVLYVAAAVPLLANGPVMDRASEPASSLPRTFARLLLDAVPQGGVLFTAGDNDTYPLWYLQQVEDYRADVTVVPVPLLNATWYREELARRWHLLPIERDPSKNARSSIASSYNQSFTATSADASALIARTADQLHRKVRVSVMLSAADRNAVDRSAQWALQGLVYSPSAKMTLEPGTITLDRAALRLARERVPPASLGPMPPSADAAAVQVQQLLRCPSIDLGTERLLVSTCGGS